MKRSLPTYPNHPTAVDRPRSPLDRSERSYYFIPHEGGDEKPGETPLGVERGADARGDPHARAGPGHSNRLRRADDRAAGRGSPDVQERPVRPLPLERGAPAG